MQASELKSYITGSSLKIVVKPNSPKTEIIGYNNSRKTVKIAVNAVPDKNKANKELVKFLSKLLKKKVSIISGLKSREKMLRIG